jgi:hypothetical protein
MIFGYCLNPAHVILSLIVRMGCDLESIVIKKRKKVSTFCVCVILCAGGKWRTMNSTLVWNQTN